MINKAKEVVIVSAIRTPIGAYRGSLKNLRSDQLGSLVIKEVLKKSKFGKDEIDSQDETDMGSEGLNTFNADS